MPVEVCGKSSEWGLQYDSSMKASLLRLAGSKGLGTTATNGIITLAGQTLAGSTDGEWKGERAPETVTARAGKEPGQVCFDLEMPAFSAAMLVVTGNFS